MTGPHTVSPDDTQASFAALMAGLHRTLKQQLAAHAHIPPRRQAHSQRHLLLRLEQMWKIEAQLIFPAFDAADALRTESTQAQHEVELLRDLALRVERGEPATRDDDWAVLQGRSALHFTRVDALMKRPAASRVDWRSLLDETMAWMAQWDDEVRAHGDIEDEDRDPVGLPPR